jgi:inner membrane protein
MATWGDSGLLLFRRSRTAGLLGVGFLAILLQFPISTISSLIGERQQRRDAAVAEVGGKWGRAQALTGPVLAAPYTHRWQEKTTGGTAVTEKTARRTILILPDRLKLRGQLAAERRSHGIFSVPVYELVLDVSGEFGAGDLQEIGVPYADVDWEHAELVMGVSDVRAIQQQPQLSWGDRRAEFLPGTGAYRFDTSSADPSALGAPASDLVVAGALNGGIRAPVTVDLASKRIAFQFPLALNGSSGLSFVPFGRETVVELQGDTDDVSFQGNWLPAERTVSDSRFSSAWSIPYLGRGYPQVWFPDVDGAHNAAVNASRFGVALIPVVDEYRMSERSVKYAFLFIFLTFTVVWLLEVLSDVRVHAIQYLLLGAALCLFYLLELSLAEHIGFAAAYAIASTAVVVMIGSYGWAILRSAPRALLVTAGVAALYAYLYILLTNEDYALLLGSVGLFAILGGVMYATRRVDWYAMSGSTQSPQDARATT